MIEQMEKKKNNPPFKQKWKNIYFFTGCALVISCGLIAITLFIASVFFASIYYSSINQLLTIISNNIFNFNFIGLIVSMYVFIIIYICILILLLIFLKKRNTITISIVGTCIGVNVILLTFMIILGVIAYGNEFQTYTTNIGGNNSLFFIIPYIFTIIFIITTMVLSCWIAINFFPKKRKVIKTENSELNIDMYMENNEDLLEENNSSPMTNQPFIFSNKHLIDKKNDEKPYLEKLEKIRLQIEPGAVPALLQDDEKSLNIQPKIQKKIASHPIKPKLDTQPLTRKNKEKIITKLPNNKKNKTEKTQPVLKAKTTSPLTRKNKEKIITKLPNNKKNKTEKTQPVLKAKTTSPLTRKNKEKIITKLPNNKKNKTEKTQPVLKAKTTSPLTRKNKEKIITKLPNNKKNKTEKTQPVLKAKTSQPLHEIKEKIIYVRDVTKNTQPTPTVIINEETTKATADNSTVAFTKQPELIKNNVNLNLKTFNTNSDVITITIQEENSEKFIQNDYPTKANIQEVASKKNTFNIAGTPYVLTEQISQPLNPEVPQPQTPDTPIAPLKVWTKEQINKAWERGLIVPTYDPELYRSDYAGALMFKDSFITTPDMIKENNVRSYNWTIVYQRPLLANGTEESSNLWPLNCNNALAKGDNYPKWKTTVTFNGYENVLKEKKWKDKRK